MTRRLDKLKLYDLFYQEVCTQSKAIDRDDEMDWYSLSIGWVIAKGFSPRQAVNFALYARYTRQYEK